MSLGLEVSLQVMGGNQAQLPSKSAKGQAALGDLFSAAMAMAMAMSSGGTAPFVTSRPDSPTAGAQGAEAIAGVAPSQSKAVSVPLTGQFEASENLSVTEVLTDESTQAPGQVTVESRALAEASGDAQVLPAMGQEPDAAGPAEAMDIPRTRTGSESLTLEEPVLTLLGSPELSETAGRASAPVPTDTLLVNGLPEVNSEKSVSQLIPAEDVAGADLPDVMEAGEDVVPKGSVDAGVGQLSHAKAVPGQAELMAQTETHTDTQPVSRSADGDAQVAPGRALASKGAEVQAAETQRENDESGQASEVSSAEKTEGSNPGSMRQPEAAQGVDFSETEARPEEVMDDREVSLKDVRVVADFLREEALKKLPRSVEIRLDPPELGKVTVLLSTRGQDVAVKFVAAAGEAQRMLQSASGDLAEALSERGLTLTGFSVGQGDSESGSRAKERQTAPSAWSLRHSGPEKGKVAVAALASTARRGAGVFDYFV